MSYDELTEELRKACSVRFLHQYYATVARELEQQILERTDKERDRLKDDLLPFVLIWYKALVNDGGRADLAEFDQLAELNTLAEFVNSLQKAGYDYPEWDGVWKSFRAYNSELGR